MLLRQPRLRRTAKWLSLAAALFVVAVDALSIWWGVGVDCRSQPQDPRVWHMGVYCGQVGGWWHSGRSGRSYEPYGPGPVTPQMSFVWKFRWDEQSDGSGTRTTWQVPLWMVAAVPALVAACAWWLDRPSRFVRFCRKCGYDRKGLESVPCPECGHAGRPVAAALNSSA